MLLVHIGWIMIGGAGGQSILVFCPEAEDLLLIDYTTRIPMFFVLTEMTTTFCANVVYTHNLNMPSNHNLLNETMLEKLEPT